MPVTDEVELDISAAIASVDEIGTALTQVIDSFQSDLEAAISTIQDIPASATDVTITPTLDDSAALAGMDDIAAAEASIETVTIDVPPIDATPIQDLTVASSDLASAQAEVQSQITGTAESVGSLSGASAIASGDLNSVAGVASTAGSAMGSAAGAVEGLATSLSSELGPAAAAVAAGIAGLGAGLGVLGAFTDTVVEKAVSAQSASERFNLILGDQAAAVEKINIGGLNTDLATLVNSLGSGSAAVKQSDATFFQLGQSAGAANGDIAETTVQINALAARAVALNPSLGSVADVADGLQRALARGGRFASQFGIALSSTEINARAAQIALARGSEEVTQYDKVAAGAAITTEKLGDSLATDIEKGSQNVEFSFRRLALEFNKALVAIGQPLVAPALDLLQEALPVGIEVAQTLGALSSSILPLFVSGLRAAGPFLKIITDGVQEIVTHLQPVLRQVGENLAHTFGDPRNAANLKSLTKSIVTITEALIPLIPLVGAQLAAAIDTTAVAFGTLVAPIAAVLDAVEKLHIILFNDPVVSDDVRKKVLDQQEQVRTFGEIAVTAAKQTREGFLDAAGAIFTALEGIGSTTRVTSQDLTFLGLNIGELRNKTDDEIKAIGKGLGLNGDQFLAWSQSVTSYIDTVVQATSSALPKIQDAFQLNGVQLQDASTIEFQLANQEKKVKDFQRNIEILHGRGLDNLVEQLLTEGPVVGGALADALVKGAPQRAQALNDQLISTQQSFQDLINYVRDEFGPAFAVETGKAAEAGGTAFGIKLGPALTRGVSGAAGEALRIFQIESFVMAPIFALQGFLLGSSVADGFVQGVNSLGEKGAVAAVGNLALDAIEIAKRNLGIHSPSRVFYDIGQQITTGLTKGIIDTGDAVDRSLQNIIDAATQRARDAAQAANGFGTAQGGTPKVLGDSGFDPLASLQSNAAWADAAQMFVDQYKKNQLAQGVRGAVSVTVAPQITFPTDLTDERARALTGVVVDTITPAAVAALRAEMAAS